MFCKAFLPKHIKSKVEFVTGMDLSWSVYKTLYQHKVPEFLDNIIVLDEGQIVQEGRASRGGGRTQKNQCSRKDSKKLLTWSRKSSLQVLRKS